MKICSKCNKNKELIDFYKNSYDCVVCVKIRNRNYYLSNKERSKLNGIKWREANKDKNKESRRQWKINNYEKYKQSREKWAKENQEKIKQKNINYRKRNPEKIKQSQERWLKNNKEKDSLRRKSYRKKNEEKISQRIKKWNEDNKIRNTENKRRWAKNNKHKGAMYTSQRRARLIRATPKWLTQEQLYEIEEWYIICKEIQWLSEEPLEVDHIIPLQGKNVCGFHHPDNLRIIPRAKNRQKSNKLLKELV